MPSCHRWASSRPSGMAEPAIAPITAAPAPVRKAWTRVSARNRSKWGAPAMMKQNDGANATSAAKQATPETPGGVANDGHGLDDRSWGDLAESHSVEELGAGHPVVGHTASCCMSGTITKPPP